MTTTTATLVNKLLAVMAVAAQQSETPAQAAVAAAQATGTRLTIAEAAAVLGVSGRRVQTLIDQGRLPAEKIGKQWRIERESVDAYAGSRRTGRPKRHRGD